MSDESDDAASADLGGLAAISSLVRGIVDDVAESLPEPFAGALERIEAAAEAGDRRMRRWLPVLRSARKVGRHLLLFGYQVLRTGDDLDTRAMLDELAAETSELVTSFPNVAELYDDVDAFDRWLDARLDKSGVDDALFRYLRRLRELVEGVVERVVEHLFEADDTKLSPERVEQFLEALDGMIRAVMDRWLADAIVEPRPGPPRPSSDEGSTSTSPREED